MVCDPYENLELTKGLVAKPGTTLINKTGGWREIRPVLDMDKCIDCRICEKYCPDMAIKRGEDGEYEVDYDYCKGCGICAEECPVDAIEMVKEEKK